jgi:hypothetical protein
MALCEYKAKDFLTYRSLNWRAAFSTISYHVAEVLILCTMNQGFHATCHIMCVFSDYDL